MKKSMHLLHPIILSCVVLGCYSAILAKSYSTGHVVREVKIGLLLDLNSSSGEMMESCVKMAHSDFYKAHPNYRTRLLFRTKNSRGVLEAASAGTHI